MDNLPDAYASHFTLDSLYLIPDAVAIAFILTIALASKSKVLGHPDIWSEPIDNLPWFGELPGYPGQRWFGSDYHRYHHRFGYGGSAPVPMAQPMAQPSGAIVQIGGQNYHQKASVNK